MDIELFHMYTKKHTLPNLRFEITIIKVYEKKLHFTIQRNTITVNKFASDLALY